MRIGLIAPPFISVPPPRYGGTELFIANLAEALVRKGVDVRVYTNGESTVNTDVRWLYPGQEWPLSSDSVGLTKEIDHNSWAFADADRTCDLIHVNSALAVPLSLLTAKPVVCTVHHPFEPSLLELYERHSQVSYVSISAHQASLTPTIPSRVIHHGIDMSQYRFSDKKQPYLCFLGRICPIKGVHNAIDIAKRACMPLKIAGEVQPKFREYFETIIRPRIDGRNIEFLGEANFSLKNELISNATAFLFPIEWNEPFGLVMIEAMACGTPVIAFPGGAVGEIVKNGVSGRICGDVGEAAVVLRSHEFNPALVRGWVEKKFSANAMAEHYSQLYSDLIEDASCDDDRDTEKEAA